MRHNYTTFYEEENAADALVDAVGFASELCRKGLLPIAAICRAAEEFHVHPSDVARELGRRGGRVTAARRRRARLDHGGEEGGDA